MTQAELVAMLRSKARKSGAQTSLYRGVSLLKQTGKWHAQINVGGKQARRSPLLAPAGIASRSFLRTSSCLELSPYTLPSSSSQRSPVPGQHDCRVQLCQQPREPSLESELLLSSSEC